MNSYELSRDWFDWCFDNTSKISPSHTALYFFIIEHNNRLGWKKEIGLPRQIAMDAIGIRNNKTFTKVFNDLEDWGFIEVVQRAKNQYSANIIALVKNTEAMSKALDKARIKHDPKHVMSIAPIDKQLNKETKKQGNDAIDFLKINFPARFEQEFQMRYSSKITDKKKFIADFNDKVDLEGLEYSAKLFHRLFLFTRNWLQNQDKYSNSEDPHQKPTYLNKVL